jgi:signal peptidase I
MAHWLRSNRGFLIFLLCFGVFRTAVADWNPIPSGSMRPTLLEGDVVLVNRLAYDLKLPLSDIVLAHIADPRRGDVVTFSAPRTGVRLIKRIVALPGDRVELRAERLYINGEAAEYLNTGASTEILGEDFKVQALRATERIAGSERRVQFLPEIAARRDFGPLLVPPDSYFALGDNRDNSEDSRFIGIVPRHLLIGHAHHILVSADIRGHWMPRLDRLAAAIR